MQTATPRPVSFSLADLAATVHGRVIGPDDAEYDASRAVMAGGFDLRPAAIVRIRDAADAAAVIRFATRRGIELAVRGGGHSGAAHGSTDAGIVIDTRELKSLDIDLADRSAWAGAGLTAGEYTVAVAQHGLATGFGDTASVGIAGITLGGGVGYLVRKHGLTIDSLLAAEVVTADGEVRGVDAEHEPDLFWAIRGGGGNFGVVTRLRFRLHAVPAVVGGMLILPATAEVVSGIMAAADAAPEELSAIVNVMSAPPMPFLPEEQHGQLVVLALLCHAGEVEDGERAMAPFRALAEPLADLVRAMSYPELYPPEDPDYHPLAEARTMFMDSIGPDEAQVMLEHLAASDAPMRVVQLRALGGAASRVPTDATAYAHRASRFMVNVASFYAGAEDRPVRAAWVRDLSAALEQDDQGAYVNFLVDEGEKRVRAAYPGATWERLVEVKRRYDPRNVFHRNQNVAPDA